MGKKTFLSLLFIIFSLVISASYARDLAVCLHNTTEERIALGVKIDTNPASGSLINERRLCKVISSVPNLESHRARFLLMHVKQEKGSLPLELSESCNKLGFQSYVRFPSAKPSRLKMWQSAGIPIGGISQFRFEITKQKQKLIATCTQEKP